MTDINNNIGTNGVNKIQNLNFEGVRTDNVQPKNYADKEIKNLDNAHSALVGRSMIKKMQKTESPKFDATLVSGVKESLASFKGNEKIIGLSDKIFDKAIENGHSYEDAFKIQQEAIEHFKA